MKWQPQDIRKLRLRLGWSAAELGRRCGCQVDLVLAWEDGRQAPDADALNQLRALFNHLEQSAWRLSQAPLAEQVMTEQRLAQITHDAVAGRISRQFGE